MRNRGLLRTLAEAGLLSLATPLAAWAHGPGAMGASWARTASIAVVAAALILAARLGAGALLSLHRRLPRRIGLLGVAGLLTLFAYEEGVHSIHHLPDMDQATTCAVAAASSHTAAVPVAIVDADRPVPAVPGEVVEASAPFVTVLGVHSGQSRAPPTSLS